MIKIKQGTISILFGCHSIIHYYLVLLSWIKLYKQLPKFWQFICIFIHDVGHFQLQYLDDFEDKKKHWEFGAKMALVLFGGKGYTFLAGHCEYSNYPKSKLYFVDKYSWYISSKKWLYTNCIFEPKIAMGYSYKEAVKLFKEQVIKSIESGKFINTHQFYLDRCKRKDE